MPAPHLIAPVALDRYLQGTPAPADTQAIDAACADDPAFAEAIEHIRAVAPTTVAIKDPPDSTAAYERVMRQVAARAGERTAGEAWKPAGTIPHRPRAINAPSGSSMLARWRSLIAVSASAVVLGAVAWGLGIVPSPASRHALQQMHVTMAGERARIQLPDGSSVLLAPESRLRYADGFGPGLRDVYLDGEALFTISHHTNVPFVVHTGTHRTRVLGTAFTVRHDSLARTVRVVVAEGRVALDDVALTSGDIGTALPQQPVAVSHDSNLNTELAWTAGRLVFEHTALRDVLPQLRRWYALDLQVADPAMLGDRMTTVFDVDRPDEMLVKLAALLNARITRSGTVITLSRS